MAQAQLWAIGQYLPGAPGTPSLPTRVTSITKDSAATVSFLPPASGGTSAITSYTVTPYITGTATTPTTTTAAGSAVSITGSDGNTYLQVPATGLTNGTAYSFSVHATNSSGAGAESGQSGTNTPLAGLVFGDDFNGPAGQNLDPEWYVYSRCGYIAQNEVEWYLPSQVVLDGNGNLLLNASTPGHSGPSYPSDGNTVRNQPWLSGACQSNTRSYSPSADGNTLTFESRFQICPGISTGMWPGLLWMEGTDYQTAWKTDPNQASWNTTGKAEFDLAEFGSSGQSGPSTSTMLQNISTSGSFIPDGGSGYSLGFDASAAMHVYSLAWKGTSAQSSRKVNWYVDAPYVSGTGPSGGTNSATLSNNAAIPVQSSCAVFMNLYLQIRSTGSTSPQACTIDYVRVYDQNIG